MPALSVSQQLDKILDEYAEKVDDTFGYEAMKIAKETARDLQNTSPKGTPHKRKYAEGWAAKKADKLGYVVYNKTNWQLTHLLEKSHVIANGNGTYGRWTPKKLHIEPAERRANEKLIKAIEEKL